MHFYWLLLGILSVWRITHLLQAEDGPWDIVVRLRRRAGTGLWGQLLDCFYCLSVWIAAPFAIYLGETYPQRLLLWLALSAGAILLERLTDRGTGEAPVPFIEESEEEYVLRRQESAGRPNTPDGSGLKV
jgi:Protein of unknown function (DUF1360)